MATVRPSAPHASRRTAALLSPALVLALSLPQAACFVRGPFGLIGAVATTAIVTAAIMSASRPPPPRVVYVPAPQPGYTWDPGYWTLQSGAWVWVDGRWVAEAPGYVWVPTHWEQVQDGSWGLFPGHWEGNGAPPPPVAAPPPPSQASPPPPPPPPPSPTPPPPPSGT